MNVKAYLRAGSPVTPQAAGGEKILTREPLAQYDPMPDDSPASKRDLAELRADVKHDLAELRDDINQRFAGVDERFAQIDGRFAQIDARFDRLRDELVEKMRDMQTEVLRAFHGWAAPLEIRLRAIPNIEERLGLLGDRVSKIERQQLS